MTEALLLDFELPAIDHERATAYHEAGHAVIAVLCGERLTGVEIVGDDHHLGSVDALRLGLEPAAGVDPAVPTAPVERRLLCVLAGPVAESIITGEPAWDEHSGDLDVAVRLALQVTGDCCAVEPYLDAARDHLEDLLCRHWLAVETLAWALLADRRLDGATVRRLLRPLLP